MRPSQIQRRTLAVLAAAQVFGGVGFFLGVTVAALLARDVSGRESLGGVPLAFAVLSGALAAGPIGAWMGRAGRRAGLVAGHLVAAGGAALVVLAAGIDSFALLCLGMAGFGLGNTSNLLARYAATDLAPAQQRARAISIVLLATAAGAIAGPNLAALTEPLAAALTVLASAGPFALAVGAYLIAATILLVLLRPDPLLASRADGRQPTAPASGWTSALRDLPAWPRLALIGVGVMAGSNVAMVAVMTMTPIHMEAAGQSLSSVGLVISLHVAGMYLPSPVSGSLADRYGRRPVVAGGGLALAVAGALAALAPGESAPLMAVSLALLGVGWNLGLVGGSALLTDAIAPDRRAPIQGAADLIMGVAAMSGNLIAGPLFHAGAFGVLGAGAAAIGAVVVLLASRARAPVAASS
ncbi:MAG TPA: MFS transporter [Thermoleophilaceae bacterium]|nr:MFS transporter [Thermoleophilaceae bacterium]